MVISYNSQLGLRFKERDEKIEFLETIKADMMSEVIKNENQATIYNKLINREPLSIEEQEYLDNETEAISQIDYETEISRKIKSCITNQDFILNDEAKNYFICESVYKASELVRISEKFTGRTFKDIVFGKYNYLLGKNKMVRFGCEVGLIKGFYYDKENKIAFYWGVDIESGEYCFPEKYNMQFTKTMQILCFVELGDIEVKILPAGRNNGGKKNVDKVTNTSNNTVYVVDSSWNQILIRTEGFAVRGHFRLQPHGEGLKDRKLIWVAAFEKHGYKRRPSAEIVH